MTDDLLTCRGVRGPGGGATGLRGSGTRRLHQLPKAAPESLVPASPGQMLGLSQHYGGLPRKTRLFVDLGNIVLYCVCLSLEFASLLQFVLLGVTEKTLCCCCAGPRRGKTVRPGSGVLSEHNSSLQQ